MTPSISLSELRAFVQPNLYNRDPSFESRATPLAAFSLAELWSDVASAYNGIAVEKISNLNMFYGRDTYLAHNSLIVPIEAYPHYVSHVVPALPDADRCGKALRLE